MHKVSFGFENVFKIIEAFFDKEKQKNFQSMDSGYFSNRRQKLYENKSQKKSRKKRKTKPNLNHAGNNMIVERMCNGLIKDWVLKVSINKNKMLIR